MRNLDLRPSQDFLKPACYITISFLYAVMMVRNQPPAFGIIRHFCVHRYHHSSRLLPRKQAQQPYSTLAMILTFPTIFFPMICRMSFYFPLYVFWLDLLVSAAVHKSTFSKSPPVLLFCPDPNLPLLCNLQHFPLSHLIWIFCLNSFDTHSKLDIMADVWCAKIARGVDG